MNSKLAGFIMFLVAVGVIAVLALDINPLDYIPND